LIFNNLHKEPRLSAFKNQLPRVEVDALWSILAYFASTDARPSSSSCKSDTCWRLASKLLLRGVLFASGAKDNGTLLPPSSSQIDSCKKEISFLESLLRSGSMENLPKNDDSLVEIVTKALALQGDDYMLNEHSRSGARPRFSEPAAMKRVREMWHGIGLSIVPVITSNANPRTGNSKLFEISEETTSMFLGQPSLLPSSPIARQCLSLQFFWILNVPAKKARFNRLLASMRSLVQGLVKDACKIEGATPHANGSESEHDLFALAFADATKKSINGPDRKALLLREAAAYHLIVSSVALACRGDTNGNENLVVNQSRSLLDIAKQVK
jgi:hypothetical protein